MCEFLKASESTRESLLRISWIWTMTEAVEAAEANFEFREALKASGADSISARAVGEISPAALRAIAQSLRSISAQ